MHKMMIKDVGMPLLFAKTIVRIKPSNASQSNAIGIICTLFESTKDAFCGLPCHKSSSSSPISSDISFMLYEVFKLAISLSL